VPTSFLLQFPFVRLFSIPEAAAHANNRMENSLTKVFFHDVFSRGARSRSADVRSDVLTLFFDAENRHEEATLLYLFLIIEKRLRPFIQ